MITFRPVRGGFDTAIADSQNFYSLDGLYRFLLKDKYKYLANHSLKRLDEYYIFEPASYDSRLGAFVSCILIKDIDGNIVPFGYVW